MKVMIFRSYVKLPEGSCGARFGGVHDDKPWDFDVSFLKLVFGQTHIHKKKWTGLQLFLSEMVQPILKRCSKQGNHSEQGT